MKLVLHTILPEPSGMIDMSEAKYELISKRALKVTGSKFTPTRYTIKLEGVRKAGFRSIFFGGVRDRRIIDNVDQWIEGFRKTFDLIEINSYGYRPEYSMNFWVYGKNGVMGPLEPIKEITSHEIFVLVEMIAPTEDLCMDIATTAVHLLMHADTRKHATLTSHISLPPPRSGNTLAMPFSPNWIKCGWAYHWTLNHRVVIDDMAELDGMFPIDYLNT